MAASTRILAIRVALATTCGLCATCARTPQAPPAPLALPTVAARDPQDYSLRCAVPQQASHLRWMLPRASRWAELLWNAGGTQLLSREHDGELWVWDVSTIEAPKASRLQGFNGDGQVVWAADGRVMVSDHTGFRWFDPLLSQEVERFEPAGAPHHRLSRDLRLTAGMVEDPAGQRHIVAQDTVLRKELWRRKTADFSTSAGKAQPWSRSTTELFAWPQNNVLAVLVRAEQGANDLDRRSTFSVRFTDWRTGRALGQLSLAGAGAIAKSPEGNTVAVSGAPSDGRARLVLLDAATRQQVGALTLVSEPLVPAMPLGWNSAGTELAVASLSPAAGTGCRWTVRVIDRSARLRFALPNGFETLPGIRWSSDGSMIKATYRDCSGAEVFDARTGRAVRDLVARPGGKPQRAMAAGPELIAEADGSTIVLRDRASQAERARLGAQAVFASRSSIALSSEGTRLAVGSASPLLISANASLRLPVPSERLYGWSGAMAFSAEGRVLAGVGAEGVAVWDGQRGSLLGSWKSSSGFRALAWSKKQGRLLVEYESSVVVFDEKAVPLCTVPGRHRLAALDNDGDRLAVAGGGYEDADAPPYVELWPVAACKPSLRAGEMADHLAFGSNGELVAAVVPGVPLRTLDKEEPDASGAHRFQVEGSTIVLVRWDTQGKEKRLTPAVHCLGLSRSSGEEVFGLGTMRALRWMALAPDGSRYVTRRGVLCDARTGVELGALPPHFCEQPLCNLGRWTFGWDLRQGHFLADFGQGLRVFDASSGKERGSASGASLSSEYVSVGDELVLAWPDGGLELSKQGSMNRIPAIKLARVSPRGCTTGAIALFESGDHLGALTVAADGTFQADAMLEQGLGVERGDGKVARSQDPEFLSRRRTDILAQLLMSRTTAR